MASQDDALVGADGRRRCRASRKSERTYRPDGRTGERTGDGWKGRGREHRGVPGRSISAHPTGSGWGRCRRIGADMQRERRVGQRRDVEQEALDKLDAVKAEWRKSPRRKRDAASLTLGIYTWTHG